MVSAAAWKNHTSLLAAIHSAIQKAALSETGAQSLSTGSLALQVTQVQQSSAVLTGTCTLKAVCCRTSDSLGAPNVDVQLSCQVLVLLDVGVDGRTQP